VIGCSVFDLVHPRDRCELYNVTAGNRHLSCVTRPPSGAAACKNRLLMRMRCNMMTRGHLLASTQSPMYRVCFTSFQYCGVNPWSVEFTSCMSVTVTAMVQSAVTKLLHILPISCLSYWSTPIPTARSLAKINDKFAYTLVSKIGDEQVS